MASLTPEGKVKAKVKEMLNEHGAWYFMPRGTVMGRSGIPDFIGCLYGQMFAIETKAAGNHPTALQKKEIADINAHGGMAMVITMDNLNALKGWLEGCGKLARI